MKNPGQLLMVALAVVFAVALCLTIALICIGASQKENPTDTAPSARTRYYIPGTSTSYLAPPMTEANRNRVRERKLYIRGRIPRRFRK